MTVQNIRESIGSESPISVQFHVLVCSFDLRGDMTQ